jgi:hypothetical protein
MSREWLWWLGEFGLAATVAVVAGFVTGDVPISILYGLFIGTVSFVLRHLTRITSQLDRQVSNMKDEALNLPTTLSHQENINPFLRRIVQFEKDELLRLAKEAEDGKLTIKARIIARFLPDYFKLAQQGDKVLAINAWVGWGTPQWDVIRQVNFDLADKGVDLTRIFIEPTGATSEDKKHIRQEMDRQKERIKVRFMKESRFPEGAKINSFFIYGKYFAYATYSKTPGTSVRHVVEEATFCTNRDELERAQQMAENLIKLSEEYK